ncbi:MAG: HIT family protein [Candidatus Hodarchaeales archaeon]
MNDCIFCKIIKGEIPSYKIYEDDDTLAFLDINPATRGHCLVIPKKHASDLGEADEATVATAYITAKKVGDLLMEKLKPDGMNVLQNNGAAAGQVIKHIHVHLIPRYLDDGIKYPLPMKKASEETLKELHDLLAGE